MIHPSSGLRRELSAILALTILGAVLRGWSFARLGLEHFDEGIYARAGLWIFSPGGPAAIDPITIPYAPPGFPILIGLAYATLGVADLSAIAVSLGCGIVTIPIAGWLGRRSFGPGAGAAAAALAALSGPHLAFSRMAMTDVPFLLCWLLAIGQGGRFLERPTLGRALGLGMLVGLAQYFKYNGWIAGVLVGLVALMDLVAGRREVRRRSVRAIGLGLVAATIAASAYLPWYLFVERHGTYAGLLEHHRSYLGGLSAWLPHWTIQIAQAIALSGGPAWGIAAWALACLAFASVAPGRPGSGASRRMGRTSRGLAILAGMLLLAAVPSLPWWIGLASTPWLLRDDRSPVRLLGAWWLVLSIMTPFYHPYARLWLPLHGAGWLIMAGMVGEIGRAAGSNPRSDEGTARMPLGSTLRARLRAGMTAVCLLLAAYQAYGGDRRPRPLAGLLGPSDSLRNAIRSVGRWIHETPGAGRELRLLARPPVSFYLGLEGRIASQPQAGVQGLLRPAHPREMALIDEALLRQEGDVDELLRRLRLRWIEVVKYRDHLNPPTLLDIDPGSAYGDSTERSQRLWLMTTAP